MYFNIRNIEKKSYLKWNLLARIANFLSLLHLQSKCYFIQRISCLQVPNPVVIVNVVDDVQGVVVVVEDAHVVVVVVHTDQLYGELELFKNATLVSQYRF
jgi:hypothetical protein